MLRNLLLAAAFVVSGSFSAKTVEMQDVTVYICVTGEVYHSHLDCRGLRNATHKIKAVPLSEAAKTRRPCKICY